MNSDAQITRGCFIDDSSNDFFMTLINCNSRPLNIIMEEDELSSRSPSPPSIKARRRHARITRDDLATFDPSAFMSPRPAPSPATSPDSLKLAFPELLQFPCPPMSDLSSSPGAHSSGLPLTPSTSDSDDGFALPSPRFNPRRAAMQPLVFNSIRERVDSDADSDSEWYHRELSNLIATSSTSQQQHLQPSRPDSVFIPSDFTIPTTKPRRASIISHTIHPCRRNIKRVSLPKYPPPPVPPIPPHLRVPPCPPPQSPTPVNLSRPPPRSSLPADCVFDPYTDGGNEGDADTDSSSAFSFTMYEIDFGDREQALPASTTTNRHAIPKSPVLSRHSLDSEFAQEIEFDDARFDLDYQFRLPLSIPATPFDLEADIAMSFERLRKQEMVLDEPTKPMPTPEQALPPVQPSPNAGFTPTEDTCSSFSFSPSPSPVSFLAQQTNLPSLNKEERTLKSKWSSSTLGSIKEERSAKKKNRERERSASAKLKLYFSGGAASTPPKLLPSPKTSKRGSSSTKSTTSPHTPTSPLTFKSPRSPALLSPASAVVRWPQPRVYKSSKRTSGQVQGGYHQASKSSSDVLVIGYGGYGGGLRRRGSNATVSSEGCRSDVSASSTSSTGLRRKPIPIEMFLRNVG